MGEKEYNAIDLFAGCGGLSLGLEMAGFNMVWANELNQDAAGTYTHNFTRRNGHSTKMVVGDIRKISVGRILKDTKGKEIHLVAAGPPCQGFSMAGRRDIDDARNALFKQLLKVVGKIRPPIFLMENVKGILSLDGGRAIGKIKESFEAIDGYRVQIQLLKAHKYCVPQIRERIFIIGTAFDCGEIKPKPKCHKPIGVEDAIGDLAFLGNGESSNTYELPQTSKYQKLMRGDNKILTNHEAAKHTTLVTERFSMLKPGQSARDLPEHVRTKKMVLYKLHPKKPARTVVTLPDDYVHYSQNRILTVREMARLQSFPDDFEFLGHKSTGGMRRRTDVPQYTQVGNAVPPLMANAIGECLSNFLKNDGF